MKQFFCLCCGIFIAVAGSTARASLRELLGTPETPFAGGTIAVYWKEPVAQTQVGHVLIHFHGAAKTVADAFARSDLEAVLVVVNFHGLSTAYSTPFAADASLFAKILDKARADFSQGTKLDAADWNQISVSSFSAGYGAVREILKTSEYFERIDSIVAADSIYAGLQSEDQERQVNELQMRDFLRFAKLATAGKRSFLVSHSAQPTPYASTTETANYLLNALKIERHVDLTIATPTWKQATSATHGGFTVFGFGGESGQDHMQHLQNIDRLWTRLPNCAVDPNS
ncbi:MAG: hypothetical protein KDB22_02575 [Planctomycetales bacterium]|nr:hypothetical protein [Planctomycetales bacterium]